MMSSICVDGTRFRAAILSLFAIFSIASDAIAADKTKTQKALDQRVVQMQTDGTVQNCERFEHNKSSSPGEITSSDELRRLIMTGSYEAELRVLEGSQPDNFIKCLKNNNIKYFPLMSISNVRIEMRSLYSSGRSCFGWGSVQKNTNWDGSTYTTEPCVKGYDPKKDKFVKSKYPGTATAYLILTDINHFEKQTPGESKERRCYIMRKVYLDIRYDFRNKKEFDRDSKGVRINLPIASCIKLYPQDWKDFIETYTRYASFELNYHNTYDVWIR